MSLQSSNWCRAARSPAARAIASLPAVLLAVATADAQLRIVTYNTLDKPFDTTTEDDQDGQFTTIFGAIASTPVNGISKRVDVVALQEQTNLSGNNTAARIAALLNDLHGVNSYQSLVVGGGTDKVAYAFDTSTLQFLGSTTFAIGTRPAHRIQLRPTGYSSPDADLYLYNVHLNASSAATRASEVTNLRSNSNALAATLDAAGSMSNFIYMGDFNFSSNAEGGYVNLQSSGTAQGIDPLQLAGWPSMIAAVSRQLTQSTRTAILADEGATGGIDDRFDLQIVTGHLMDGDGLSYIGTTVPGMELLDHSYRAFGNDGTSFNLPITLPAAGRSQSSTVLQALHNFSDHLPVVVDFQIPAVLNTMLSHVPTTLTLDEPFQLELKVWNDAAVTVTLGADELAYSLLAEGAVSGAADGVDTALGGQNLHLLSLDTGSLGAKMGTITISSSSQAVENGLVMLPIAYEVVAPPVPGDYNGDGKVTAADYTVWRNGVETNDLRADGTGPLGVPDEVVDTLDYAFWKAHYGAPENASATAWRVPEPASLGLMTLAELSLGGVLLRRRPRADLPMASQRRSHRRRGECTWSAVRTSVLR